MKVRKSVETGVVTTKGQVVIPSRIRHRHKIKRGTKVCFLEVGDDIVLRPITNDYIEGLRGSLKTGGKLLHLLREEKRREHDL